MSPAWIRKRPLARTVKRPKGGSSFQVLYRRGGREATIESAGTFARDREAKMRRDLVAGWLAQGLNPKVEMAKLNVELRPARSYTEETEAMIQTRHDAADETIRMMRKALDKVVALRPDLAAKTPSAWDVRDVQELVAAMVDTGLAPATVDKYLIHGPKLVLDFADVKPNPARDKRVKLPAAQRAELTPPTASHVLAVLERVPAKLVLPLVVLEQTGMRVGELASLPWGDVDVAGNRFRLSRERVKTRHPRWVQLPAWLMDVVADSCPSEDRSEFRLVFPFSDSTLRQAMVRACRSAGVPVFSPHDLRHRRASLWHGQGVTVAELKERGGWVRSEIPLDVYSHVLMDASEIQQDAFERALVRLP
jgi:integrase